MRNAIRLRCVSGQHAVEVYKDVKRRGAPCTVGFYYDGSRVTFPGDQPAFVMAVVETAVAEGHVSDDDGALCIASLSDVLPGAC